MHVRRSVILSSMDRTFAMFVRFATLIVTARLLTPAEIGIAVLGTAVFGIATTIRDFGGVSYLIQVDDPTPARVRTVFTVQLLFTLPLALLCFLLAGPAGAFYEEPGLRDYLWVTAICFLIGPFYGPIYALLSRRFAFGPIAFLNVVMSLSSGGVTIGLAMAGFSFMSFAWASLVSTALGLALSFIWHPRYPVFRIATEDWRAICNFGFADSVRNLLNYMVTNVPLLVFGRTLGAGDVGLYQRAFTLSSLPTTTLMAGLGPVLLPAFASHAREKRELKLSYFRSLELITVLLWPCTLLIFILAKPAVLVLLGSQWLALVPLVQIMSASFLMWFPVHVTNPILIATGGVRDALKLAMITIPAMILLQCLASLLGLMAVAWSGLIAIIYFVVCAVLMVRRRVPFEWNELGAALKKSLLVALVSIVGPVGVTLAAGGPNSVSIAEAFVACLLAGAGWLLSLGLTRHPMFNEVQQLVRAAYRVVHR